jgi:streptogramin lyase
MRPTAIALCLLSLLAATASGAGTGGEALRLGGIPLQLLSARGQLWVLLCDHGCSGQARHSLGRVVEIDPRREQVIASATIARPGAIAVDASGVYATDFWRDTVRRLDPRTLQPAASLKLRLPFFIVTSTRRDDAFLPEQLAVGDGSVWVVSDRGALARADTPLRRVTAMLRLPADAFQAIATAPGTVWLSESLLGIYRVDTHTNRVAARIPIGSREHRFVAAQLIPTGRRLLALGEWTNAGTVTSHNGLARLDPRSNRLAPVTGLLPGQLTAAFGGSLWVGQVNSNVLDQIDPGNGKVIRRLHSHVGVALAFAGRHLWTISHDGNLEPVPIR